jgi:hypothetical protein
MTHHRNWEPNDSPFGFAYLAYLHEQDAVDMSETDRSEFESVTRMLLDTPVYEKDENLQGFLAELSIERCCVCGNVPGIRCCEFGKE